jgi:hypothetical protein
MNKLSNQNDLSTPRPPRLHRCSTVGEHSSHIDHRGPAAVDQERTSPKILPRRLKIADICPESSPPPSVDDRGVAHHARSARRRIPPTRMSVPGRSPRSADNRRLTRILGCVNVVHRGWPFRLPNEEMNVIRLAVLLRAVGLLAAVRRRATAPMIRPIVCGADSSWHPLTWPVGSTELSGLVAGRCGRPKASQAHEPTDGNDTSSSPPEDPTKD